MRRKSTRKKGKTKKQRCETNDVDARNARVVSVGMVVRHGREKSDAKSIRRRQLDVTHDGALSVAWK